MHDGRFKTLEEVLEHYTGGIKATATLDPKFKDENGRVRPIPLTPLEKKAVIAFWALFRMMCLRKTPNTAIHLRNKDPREKLQGYKQV